MATKKSANQNAANLVTKINSIGMKSAIRAGYTNFYNEDGSKMKVNKGEGYLGVKQFEGVEGRADAAAQPGYSDVVRCEGNSYSTEFHLCFSPIKKIKPGRGETGASGTVTSINGSGLTTSTLMQAQAAAFREMNRISDYCQRTGIAEEIVKAIAGNVTSGYWLGRNYVPGIKVEVCKIGEDRKLGKPIDPSTLWQDFYDALFGTDSSDKTEYIVKATVPSYAGVQVWPSQLMIEKDVAEKVYGKGYSRVLLCDSEDGAMFTPQRVGRSLRSYDTWTDRGVMAEYDDSPLPVSSTSSGLRAKGQGVLSLIHSGNLATTPEPQPDDYFVMANFVHGGMFNIESAEKDSKKSEVTEASAAE